MGKVKMQGAALLIFLSLFLFFQIAGSNPGLFEGQPHAIFRLVIGVIVLVIGIRRFRQGWLEQQRMD